MRPCANGNVLGFQFTPLREGRHKAFVDKFKPKLFQFTPLREGRPARRRVPRPRCNFNSRPSARGDAIYNKADFQYARISIHAPPRGATKRDGEKKEHIVFQFTPLREGRQSRQASSGSAWTFQFTPLREGRLEQTGLKKGELISIHAPPRGATFPWRLQCGAFLFQFTPLREGRPNPLMISFSRSISIHAPPRGATVADFSLVDEEEQFQFTPLREGRLLGNGVELEDDAFQFTPLREGRPGLALVVWLHRRISIHAPPRGATGRAQGVHTGAQQISIHAPPRGATCRGLYFLYRPPISIHAPPRGATMPPQVCHK